LYKVLAKHLTPLHCLTPREFGNFSCQVLGAHLKISPTLGALAIGLEETRRLLFNLDTVPDDTLTAAEKVLVSLAQFTTIFEPVRMVPALGSPSCGGEQLSAAQRLGSQNQVHLYESRVGSDQLSAGENLDQSPPTIFCSRNYICGVGGAGTGFHPSLPPPPLPRGPPSRFGQ
jgi:hypothetical protein